MKNFKFLGKNRLGEKVEGYFWADSLEDVRLHLRSEEIYILRIEETLVNKQKNTILKKRKWSYSEIIDFSYQMGLMLNSGISIKQILALLIQQKNKKIPYDFISEALQRGQALSKSLQELGFPDIAISLLIAGELSGNLAQAFDLIHFFYNREKKLRQDLLSALAYPAFLLFMLIVFVLGMVLFILPSFEKVFASMNANLPPLTANVFLITHLLQSHIREILLGLAIIFSSLIGISMNKQANFFLQHLWWVNVSKYEWYGGIYYERLANVWAILLDSGISISKTLEITQTLWGNAYAGKCHKKVIEQIETGKNLHKALQDNGLGNKFLWDLIFIGEESGELVPMLRHISHYYQERNKLWRKKIQRLVEPVLLSVMGLCIGFLVLVVMLPMFNSITMVTNL